MAQLIYKPRKYHMPELGDMIHRITVYSRAITAPIADPRNYGLDFTKVLDVWTNIETMQGITMFDNVNIERVVTHKLIIRYLPFITAEYWIAYKGEYYDIIHIEDWEKENRFQVLYCNVRGDTTKQVNWA